jgi:hypothetical protein
MDEALSGHERLCVFEEKKLLDPNDAADAILEQWAENSFMKNSPLGARIEREDGVIRIYVTAKDNDPRERDVDLLARIPDPT